MRSLALIAAAAVVLARAAQPVATLNDASFDRALASDDAVLVKFFAPWCGHCKSLAPTWEALPEQLDGKTNVDGATVRVAKIDCTSPGSKSVCSRAGVRGYPTVKLFFRGHAHEHSGARSASALEAFALRGFADAPMVPFAANTAEVGADGSVDTDDSGDADADDATPDLLQGSAASAEAASSVVELTDETFEHDSQAATGATTGAWLVEFYAPWCPHCKSFAPTYEKVARALKAQGVPVTAAKVDVTASPATARRFGVLSYPTLRLFKGGRVWEFPADKGRSVAALVAFAKSGYKAAPSEPVPPPSTVWSQLRDEVNQSLTDVLALARSNPNAVVLLAGAAFLAGMVVMLLVTVVTSLLVPIEPMPRSDIEAAASRASGEADDGADLEDAGEEAGEEAE